jgi:membrane complex biogenesis BtpA family protein
MNPRALPFSARPAFIGVVHLLPTPGSPGFGGRFEAVLERAVLDARALIEGGCDALIVENFGDVPFFAGSVPPETVASMSLALASVIALAGERPVGVNVLRNDVRSALGLCAATAARFVRVNVHTGAAVTDQGVIEGRAAETLRERARLCPAVAILADVHVKHATPLGSETLVEAALDARSRGAADALILTGPRTGLPPARAALLEVRERLGSCPLLIGSGLGEQDVQELLALVDGAIVGTALKRSGRVEEPVEEARVARMRARFDSLRR